MRQWLLWLFIAAVLGGVALAWMRPQAAPSPPAELGFEPAAGDHVLQVEAEGLVAAEVEQDVVVPPGLAQPTIESLVDQGTEVKKGAVVATLSTYEARLQLIAARAALSGKRAELAKQEREDAVKVAELADAVRADAWDWTPATKDEALIAKMAELADSDLQAAYAVRQKQARLDAARALAALAEKGPDPLQVERLELRLRSARRELTDLERKSAVQATLKGRGFASGLKAREASDAAQRKRKEIDKDENLLAKEREGATAEERRKLALAVEALVNEVALATKDLEERGAVLGLEREKKKLEIRSKEEVLGQKERAIASARLLAPIDGTVIHKSNFWSDQPHQVGSQVWEGVAILSVAKMGRPRALVMVGERAIDLVKEGQPAVLSVSAEPGPARPGKVLSVSRVSRSREASDAAGAKDFEVTVGFGGEARHLKPNLPVKATIEVGRLTGVYRVPKEAVFEDQKSRALTVHAAGIAESLPVTASGEDQDWYYLQSGLPPGARLTFE